MSLPDVLDAQEVQFTIEGTPDTIYRFPLAGGVRPSLINPFAGKVVIGDNTRDNELLLSSWVMSDWRGGIMVEDMDETRHADRCWTSTLDTRGYKQLFLPPQRQTATGLAAATAVLVGHQFGAHVYVLQDNRSIYRAAVSTPDAYALAHATGFGVDPSVGYSDMCVFRTGAARWLVVACSAGYARYDGTTWTSVAGSGSTPFAQQLVKHDGFLWAIDGSGTLWKCTDLTTDAWTALATVPTEGPKPGTTTGVRRLVVFQNVSGDPAIHAVTFDGIWYYDEDGVKWRETPAQWPYTEPTLLLTGGAAVWRSELFVSVGNEIFAYNGSTIRNIGFSRDDGLPTAQQGPVQEITPVYNGIVAMLSTGYYMLWDGVGWHFLGSPSVPYAGFVSTTNTALSVHIAHATGVNRFILPHGVFNPRHATNPLYASTGTLLTPWFDASMPNTVKTAVAVEYLAESLATGKTLTVEYQVDSGTDSGSWSPLITATTTNAPTTPTTFASGAGLTFKRIRFKYTLASDSGSVTPVLRYCTLKYLKRPRRLYAYRFQVDCSAAYDGVEATVLRDRLLTVTETDVLVTAQFYRDGQELVSSPIIVTYLSGAAATGTDTRSLWDMAISEIT